MTTPYRKKLIEVALPLEAINAASAREKSIRQSHPITIHLWWARRPLVAARAVLFAQLVDDPSSWPELFSTEEAQNRERQRLFRLIEDLVIWENSADARVINAARLEIARSHARSSTAASAQPILADGVGPETVNEYLRSELPAMHDPFAGGGTIPLEAQRLGLRTVASDLNPVAVMVNKALIEIPAIFAGASPVNPSPARNGALLPATGARGLAEDIEYYGTWMREEAKRRVGHLYPEVELPTSKGGRATVIAWLWARTVPSPDPAFNGAHVPLVSNFWLSTKEGKKTWLRPVVDKRRQIWRFEIATGEPRDENAIASGTKEGRGDFACLLSGAPMPSSYVREMGRAGRMSLRMLAIVAEGHRERVYLPATPEAEALASVATPESAPTTELPTQALGFRVQNYGLRLHRDLFTPRQLVALTTLSDLIPVIAERVRGDAGRSGLPADQATEYGKAVATYLALLIDNLADLNNSLTRWKVDRECPVNLFARQAIPMTWDFPEANPFSGSAGSISSALRNLTNRVEQFDWLGTPARVLQADALQTLVPPQPTFVSTDPPYYDNIGYADLSDFFYVWLRRSLSTLYPGEFRTLLTPKEAELIAEPFRHGGKEGANAFFIARMIQVVQRFREDADGTIPIVIYYAFKQSESGTEGSASTGWESFLEALLGAGCVVDGTWPFSTELNTRMRGRDSNALASSVALVCRGRPDDAPSTTRGEFRRVLRKELPDALKKLQQGNIAPVDVAQASIGPGMAIFSRHRQVAEADGTPMSVRAALQLINEVLDEYLASGEGDFDADTRFAITWFEQHKWEAGPFGDAENIAKARNISVQGVVQAGICRSGAGKVRLIKRDELPGDYDPLADERPTVWEFTQHMIRYLEDQGEEAAARHMKRLGSRAEATRELAYRLYNTCERKKWAEDARAYNGLILAWPELEKLAARMSDEPPATSPSKPTAKGKKSKPTTKGQQALFEGDEK